MKKTLIAISIFLSFNAFSDSEMKGCLREVYGQLSYEQEAYAQSCLQKASDLEECLYATVYLSDRDLHDQELLNCQEKFQDQLSMESCLVIADKLIDIDKGQKHLGACLKQFAFKNIDECTQKATDRTFDEERQIVLNHCFEVFKKDIDLDYCQDNINSKTWKGFKGLKNFCSDELLKNLSFNDCVELAKKQTEDESFDLYLLSCLEHAKDITLNECTTFVKSLKISSSKFGGLNICVKKKRKSQTEASDSQDSQDSQSK